MKRYLRTYINYQQNDWMNWLSLVEFASNVCIFASIEIFLFQTNHEFEPRMSFDSDMMTIQSENFARERLRKKKTINIDHHIKNIWDFVKKNLIKTKKNQKKFANKHWTRFFEYRIEQKIWLSIKNIKTNRSFEKLNHKMIDSFEIVRVLN